MLVAVGVSVLVGVEVRVAVSEGVMVGVRVKVGVGVGVGVSVRVGVCVCVGVMVEKTLAGKPQLTRTNSSEKTRIIPNNLARVNLSSPVRTRCFL